MSAYTDDDERNDNSGREWTASRTDDHKELLERLEGRGAPDHCRAAATAIRALQAERDALRRDHARADQDWSSIAMWMGFAACTIKCNEPWSDRCEQHWSEAQGAFARLSARSPANTAGGGE